MTGACLALALNYAALSACSVGSECDFGLCKATSVRPTVDAQAPGPINEPDANAPCNLLSHPKDSPSCVDESFGVFVSSAAQEGGNGSRVAPFRTISAALAQRGDKSRLYLCEGPFKEHVVLTLPVAIFGGFSCGTWAYTGQRPRIGNADPGYALDIQNVNEAVRIADVEIVAASPEQLGQNSIAVRVVSSTNVTFDGVTLIARSGSDGAPGNDGIPAAKPNEEPRASLNGRAPTRLGILTATGDWQPESGNAGTREGQADGGAPGGIEAGSGGGGGGASVAIVSLNANVTLRGELVVGRGGDGGSGGRAGTQGGAGAGGSGGIAVGWLTLGAEPDLRAVAVRFAVPIASKGGPGGAISNAGPPGVQAQSARIEVLSEDTTASASPTK